MTLNPDEIAATQRQRLEYLNPHVIDVRIDVADFRSILDDRDALKIELAELDRDTDALDGMVARMTAGLAVAEARGGELKKALEAIAKAEFGVCPIMHGTHDWGRGRFNDLRKIARVALGLTEPLK